MTTHRFHPNPIERAIVSHMGSGFKAHNVKDMLPIIQANSAK